MILFECEHSIRATHVNNNLCSKLDWVIMQEFVQDTNAICCACHTQSSSLPIVYISVLFSQWFSKKKKKNKKQKIKLTIYNNKKRPSLIWTTILDFVLNSNAPCKFALSFFLGTFQLFLCNHRFGQILASLFGRFHVRFHFIYEQFTYLALPRNIVLLYLCFDVPRYEKLIEYYVFE